MELPNPTNLFEKNYKLTNSSISVGIKSGLRSEVEMETSTRCCNVHWGVNSKTKRNCQHRAARKEVRAFEHLSATLAEKTDNFREMNDLKQIGKHVTRRGKRFPQYFHSSQN